LPEFRKGVCETSAQNLRGGEEGEAGPRFNKAHFCQESLDAGRVPFGETQAHEREEAYFQVPGGSEVSLSGSLYELFYRSGEGVPQDRNKPHISHEDSRCSQHIITGEELKAGRYLPI
jgi:hypothetical protein